MFTHDDKKLRHASQATLREAEVAVHDSIEKHVNLLNLLKIPSFAAGQKIKVM
jgi:tRNA(Leu) C34 or U34 (ribose-2'-O)-methylase TrmL